MVNFSIRMLIRFVFVISTVIIVLAMPSRAAEAKQITIYDKRVAAKYELDGIYISQSNQEMGLITEDKIISIDANAFTTVEEMLEYTKLSNSDKHKFLISRLNSNKEETIFEYNFTSDEISTIKFRDSGACTFVIGFYDSETNTLCGPHGIMIRGFKSGYICGYLPKITDGIDLSIDKDNHRIDGTAQTDVIIGDITVNEEDFIAIEPISPDIISEANCFTMPMADKAAIGPAYLMIEGTVYPFGLITDFDEDTGIFRYSHFGLSFYFKYGGFALGLSGAGVYQEGYFVGSIDKASVTSWSSGIGRLASYEINTYLRNK